MNSKLFLVLRRLANGSLKPHQLPRELHAILSSKDVEDIFSNKSLDEWYKAKGGASLRSPYALLRCSCLFAGHIARFNANKTTAAPLLWMGYLEQQTSSSNLKRKHRQDEPEKGDPAPKRSKGAASQAEPPPEDLTPPIPRPRDGRRPSSPLTPAPSTPRATPPSTRPTPLASQEPDMPAGDPSNGLCTPPPENRPQAKEAPPVTTVVSDPLPSPAFAESPPPRPRVVLGKHALEKLRRLRPVQNYEVFDKGHRHAVRIWNQIQLQNH